MDVNEAGLAVHPASRSWWPSRAGAKRSPSWEGRTAVPVGLRIETGSANFLLRTRGRHLLRNIGDSAFSSRNSLLRTFSQIAKFMGPTGGPTWVLTAPGGPHVGPMNLAIWPGYLGSLERSSLCGWWLRPASGHNTRPWNSPLPLASFVGLERAHTPY